MTAQEMIAQVDDVMRNTTAEERDPQSKIAESQDHLGQIEKMIKDVGEQLRSERRELQQLYLLTLLAWENPLGLLINSSLENCFFNDSTFGVTTAHVTRDFTIFGGSTLRLNLIFVNVTLASGTEISSTTDWVSPHSRISFQRLDQTANNHKTYYTEGVVTRDTSIADVSPSVWLTPLRTNTKLVLTVLRKQVASGAAANVSVKVRCSVSGDGAAYNGNRPRLIVKAAYGCGKCGHCT